MPSRDLKTMNATVNVKVYQLKIWALVFSGLLLIPVSALPKKLQRVPNGMWGGQHVRVDVGAKVATIDFDCAHGTISGPLLMDAKGQFSWKGTYSREHGGPVRLEENDAGESAIFSGSIKGSTMKLTVRLKTQNQALDSFVLTHGRSGMVRKCL